MINTDFLYLLDRFHLIVHKRVTSNYVGTKRSISPGRGLIIKDHRIYAPGDDIRSIDWKVYARTDKFHVKQYEEDKNLTVHIIVDSSGSMGFGKPSKFNYASQIAVGFAYLALRENEKFRLSVFGSKLTPFKPRKGVTQLMSIVNHLNNVRCSGETSFIEMMSQYQKMITSRALVVIISDFLTPIDELKESLARFAGHDIKIIRIFDPVEHELTLRGDYKLTDMETDSVVHTFISPSLRNRYLKRLENHNHELQKICDSLKADFFTITSDTPIFDSFYKILS